MTLDEATDIIRKLFPNSCIWYGFNFSYKTENGYVFVISCKPNYIEEDNTLCFRFVDEKTGELEIFDFWSISSSDRAVAISDAFSKRIKIDI